MADRIIIKDLLVRGIIGINDWERNVRQDILINLDIYSDLKIAGISDAIEDTVNYKLITKSILKCVETTQRFTVEALAEDIAKIALEDPLVDRVVVRVEKPGALRFSKSVGVEIERTNHV